MLKKLLPIMCLLFCVTVSQAQTISTGNITSPLCPGNAIGVPFTSTGTFNSPNIFIAELSDSGGSFSNPVIIGNSGQGSVSGTYNGNISAGIPANTIGGLHYRIRVISTSPAVTGSANATAVPISALPPTPTVSASTGTICNGQSSQLTGTATGYNITWWNTASSGTNLASGNNYTVSPTSATSYYAQASFVQSGSQTFNYSGSTVNWTVPPGIYAVSVDVIGASGNYGITVNNTGQTNNGPNGGLGGEVKGSFAVNPGDVLYITVGGAGGSNGVSAGGFNGGGIGGNLAQGSFFYAGGGGGGASDIRYGGTGLSNRIFVAGGGGGGSPGSGGGNGGGSLSSGTLGQGGNAGNANGSESGNAEGGGGGGYYGGSIGFGGTGGSNYNDPSATNVTNNIGVNRGNGSITITYSGSLTCVSAARAAVTVNVNQPPTPATITVDSLIVCGSLTTGSLGGNSPTVGAGVWTQTSGLGTSTFSSASSGTSTATASQGGAYVYTWTISNAPCAASSASIPVNYYLTIPAISAVAGAPATACPGQTVELSATSPGNIIYWWNASSGGINLGNDSGTGNFAVAPASTSTYYAQAQLVAVDQKVFNYTGSMVSWVVPAGVDSILVDVQGAAGGNYPGSFGGTGGAGGRVQATYAVTPGETLYVTVGGMGTNNESEYLTAGYNGGGYGYPAVNELSAGGGGGGGGSDIRIGGTDVTNRVFVAGGGGGEGVFNEGGFYDGGNGGAGGDLTGGSGDYSDYPTTLATGGTQTAGGQGSAAGCEGFLAQGGGLECFGQYGGGGGGGGGYYGGGAGNNGSGGGGGSGYAAPGASNVVFTSGYQTGNGLVIISYSHAVQCFSPARTPLTVTVAQIPAPVIIASGSTNFCDGDSVALSVSQGAQNDISETGIYSGTYGNDQWQSFEPTKAGYTTGIAVYTNGCPNQNVTFSIYSGIGVSGSLIYSANVFISSCNSWQTISIPSSAAVNLTPGADYTFRIQGSALQLIANNSAYGSYYSDAYGLNPPWRLDFITTVSPAIYPVQWYNNNVLIPGATGTVYNASLAGSYTCQNVSPFCTSASSNAIDVTTIPLPAITFTGNPSACNTVTLSAYGGNTYAWSGGVSPNTANNAFSTSGTYTVTVTNSSGCTDTASQLIIIYPPVSPAINGIPSACTSDTLTATGGVTYVWSDGINPDSATNNFVTSGTYYVTVSNTYGCSSTASQQVTIYPAPSINISGNPASCTLVTLTASGGDAYAWSGGSSTGTAVNTFSTGDTYTVTVSNSFGCSSTASQLVTIYPQAVAGINGATAACNVVTLTATGGASYIWSGGSSANSAINTFTSGGNYSVTVTDANGCIASASATVTVYGIPVAGITGNSSACGSVTLTAGTGLTYTWNSGNAINSAVNTFENSGTYTVTVSNGGVCTATASQTIIVNSNPVVLITGTSTSCGGSVSLTASGGASYHWSGGAHVKNATDVFTTSGTYTVTVTGANGCPASSSRQVTINPKPVVAITGNVPTCGPLALTATGGDTYLWSGGSSIHNAVDTFNTSGSYRVTVTNAYGCTASALTAVHVNQRPSEPGLINGSASASNCAGLPELTYSIAPVPLATYYTWTITHLATFADGDTGSSVNVNFATATVGNAIIKVKAGNNCGASAFRSDTITITHNCAAKNEEEANSGVTPAAQLQPYLKAYPNPTFGQLRIDFGALANEQYSFKVYDVLGNLVHSEFYMAETGDNTKDFDFSALGKGVYFIRVSSESVGVNTLRIVVQ